MRVSVLSALLSLTLVGCERGGGDTDDKGEIGWEADGDGDGIPADQDCDDTDPATWPGAEETCDGVDNDCDGDVDEGVTTEFFTDGDGDGFGDPDSGSFACEPTSSQVEDATDCDDGDAEIHPEAAELCDGIDNDCDAEVDEEDALTWYPDTDGDGFGDPDGETVEDCAEVEGYTLDATDCDDTTPLAYPGADEICDELDNDCDDDVDEDVTLTFYVDVDGDGWGDTSQPEEACSLPTGYAESPGDCDDGDAAVNPDATEVCDDLDVDEDCSGQADDDDSGVDTSTMGTWYADGDSDGYGDAGSPTTACEQPSSSTTDATDCDDTDGDVHPGATEVCDAANVDEDCSGDADDADSGVDTSTMSTWYADGDSDGYGDAGSPTTACDQPSGSTTDDTDCDDSDEDVNPGETEVCNEIDDDCDGHIDDADSSLNTSSGETFYADSDSDGYGDASSTTEACEAPSGYTDNDEDCDDGDDTVYEGADELCDGIDNDCDGTADAGSWGADDICAGESCDDLLDQDSSLTDDDYYLDPDGDGTGELYTCDMSTDGGGWTLVVDWDRENEGDDLTDFETEFTELYNNMGRWDDNKSTYIRWADKGANNDAMAFEREIEVPNAGETLLDVSYYGSSMDNSGTWFFVEAGGADVDLLCRTHHGNAAGTSKAYNSTELSYVPGYSCGSTSSGTWTWEDVYQGDAGADAEVFHLHSLHRDSDGDQSRLYWVGLWVR